MNPHDIRFFASAAEFRDWLEEHHATQPDVWVGFRRRSSGLPSPTWEEAVDAALSYGWIDGIRKSLDDTSFTNRFTPRRRTSNWSARNINRIRELTEAGLIRPPGLRAFEERDRRRDAIYSYEKGPATLPEEAAARLRSDEAAWQFFSGQAPSYRNAAAYWVTSAKQEATRERRLAQLIEASAAGRRVGALTPPQRKAPAE